MTRFHCLKCNEDAVYVYANDGHHFGCNGRVIPIATLCSEPTVIDESDLAPGMVVVTTDDYRTADVFLCSPDAVIHEDMAGAVLAERQRYMDDVARVDVVRYVAGEE